MKPILAVLIFASSLPALLAQKAAAPVDLTGYWVSIVTEDWRWRMVTPSKGDFASVPLNAEGAKLGETWDPAKDEAAGQQCKAYGAPALMRIPGRLHITWQDDNTLKIETDSGTQTRLFHFGAKAASTGKPSLQGDSSARWEGTGLAARLRHRRRSGGRIVHRQTEAADSVVSVQRARDRAGGWHQSDFARAFGSVAAHFVGNFDQDDVDSRRVLGLQDAAIAQQQRIRRGVRAGEIFRERIAQPHVNAAFHLSRAAFGIDGAADVVRRYYALDAAVVVQDHHLRGVAERHVRGRIGQRFRSAGRVVKLQT
jgi:hypothetical protein